MPSTDEFRVLLESWGYSLTSMRISFHKFDHQHIFFPSLPFVEYVKVLKWQGVPVVTVTWAICSFGLLGLGMNSLSGEQNNILWPESAPDCKIAWWSPSDCVRSLNPEMLRVFSVKHESSKLFNVLGSSSDFAINIRVRSVRCGLWSQNQARAPKPAYFKPSWQPRVFGILFTGETTKSAVSSHIARNMGYLRNTRTMFYELGTTIRSRIA